MANPVTVADIEARWRHLTSDEYDVATALIADAWAELTTRVRDLDARVVAETLDGAVVVRVIAAMVLRVMRNPDGKIAENIDDYGYRRSDAVADGSLYVTPGEIALLVSTDATTRRSVPLSAYGDWQRAYP